MPEFEGFSSGNEIVNKHASRWRKLSFGVPVLDRLSSGGIPMRGIFELAGDPGSGKTQIALKLALEAQRQIKGSSVVYICTEHMFPSGRLLQMEAEYKRQNSHDEAIRCHQFVDNVLVEHIRCVPKLMACLFDRLPALLEKTLVSLLIIDSITNPFLEDEDYVSRAQTFRTMVHRLQVLQERHNFAIFVTNQVRAVIDSATLDDERTIPALGLAWSTLIHTRMQLSRLANTKQKLCSFTFGSTTTPGQGFFQIDETGPVDVSDAVSPTK
ncbi:DNA repair protein XRCC3 [Anopheles ziemanni]|uniref:DNA repair protein XRCC3 n=1 Tax=Anopheles coustani TaxID=139045 RepID=UPI00265B3651|nr:DNA repair protein XRCC3 [Anopheles coustani]XP_058172488.1 DNA repair protein XRCC3 [Anopheles ziemanni]